MASRFRDFWSVPYDHLGKNFSLGGFSCGLTIKNQKLKISSGLVPNKSILPLKPPPEDFTPNISILEEITRKISFSKISKISKKTLISAHQKSKRIIRNNQSTPSKYTSGTMDSISSNSHGIGSLCEFSKKNSGIVDEQPKKNKRKHKNELQTSTSSTIGVSLLGSQEQPASSVPAASQEGGPTEPQSSGRGGGRADVFKGCGGGAPEGARSSVTSLNGVK